MGGAGARFGRLRGRLDREEHRSACRPVRAFVREKRGRFRSRAGTFPVWFHSGLKPPLNGDHQGHLRAGRKAKFRRGTGLSASGGIIRHGVPEDLAVQRLPCSENAERDALQVSQTNYG